MIDDLRGRLARLSWLQVEGSHWKILFAWEDFAEWVGANRGHLTATRRAGLTRTPTDPVTVLLEIDEQVAQVRQLLETTGRADSLAFRLWVCRTKDCQAGHFCRVNGESYTFGVRSRAGT